MQRESLIKTVKGLDRFVRLMASGPDGMVVNTLGAINNLANFENWPGNDKNPPPTKAYIPNNNPNNTDNAARTISAITGFIDGAF
jgi:hypothetical protein